MAEGNQVCSICLDAFKDPKTISCNHVFCSGCLERHVLQNGINGRFACPLCNREVKISIEDINNVKGEVDKERHILSRVSPKCDVCGPKISATSRCLDCEENYCQACSTVHIKMKSSRNHTLSDLGVLDWEEKVTLYRHIFCPEHPEEEIKIVCKTCKNIPICQFCKILKHDTHKSRILADEAMERRSILEKNLTLCKTQLEYLELCTRNSEARDEDDDRSEEEEICKIIHQEDELVCLLQYLNERIKIQAQHVKLDIRQRYTKDRKENEGYKEKIAMENIKCRTLQGEAREMIDIATDFQVVKMADSLSEKFKRLEENSRSCNIHPKQDQRNVITPAAKWMQIIDLKMIGLITDVTKEESRKMTIFLRCTEVGSSTRLLKVDCLLKIETIKKEIAKKFCIEGIGEVVLRFVGKELKNERRLCGYDIQDGSTLECTVRPLRLKQTHHTNSMTELSRT